VAEAIKVKSLEVVEVSLLDLKAVKCLLKQRLPKFGFTSRKALSREEVGTKELSKFQGDKVDLLSLKEAKFIRQNTKTVKIIDNGDLNKALEIAGIAISKGAKEKVLAAGGKVVE